ncbi:LOW QUALITY PROTEIN: hypothetical protein M8C21_021311, partial [Ambrosia artemisiifolia]
LGNGGDFCGNPHRLQPSPPLIQNPTVERGAGDCSYRNEADDHLGRIPSRRVEIYLWSLMLNAVQMEQNNEMVVCGLWNRGLSSHGDEEATRLNKYVYTSGNWIDYHLQWFLSWFDNVLKIIWSRSESGRKPSLKMMGTMLAIFRCIPARVTQWTG